MSFLSPAAQGAGDLVEPAGEVSIVRDVVRGVAELGIDVGSSGAAGASASGRPDAGARLGGARAARLGRRPPAQKPGKVQAIGIMTLVGGILALINFLIVITSFGLGSMGICCVWPGFYYGLVVGIMAIVKGAALIGANASNETPPKAVAIMQIINIINFDVANLVMGILTLVFLGDPEVAACYRDPNSGPNPR